MWGIDPNLGLEYGWPLGFDGWNAGMDANLRRLGAIVHLEVTSHTVVNPPASPIQGAVEGARYIIPNGATGVWAAHVGEVARYIEGTWEYYVPKRGWSAWHRALGRWLIFTGLAWEELDYVLAARTVNGHPLTADVVVTSEDVGLPLVDNTPDAAKPVSVAQQAALDLKASLAALNAKTALLVTGWGTGLASGATLYFAPNTSLNGSGTEIQRRVPLPACTVSRLRLHLGAVPTVNLTVTVRKNGAATGLTLTAAAGTAAGTVVEDLAHNVAYADGDLFDYEVVNGAATSPANCTISAVMS